MSELPTPLVSSVEANQFFAAVEGGNADQVRQLLMDDRSLSIAKQKSPIWKYDNDVELDAYKFLGAYLGGLTGLHLAILRGQDPVALSIIDATLNSADLDVTFGGGNTALHLATFLGARDIVEKLLERGADATIKNTKGFRPIDVVDDPEMRDLYRKS